MVIFVRMVCLWFEGYFYQVVKTVLVSVFVWYLTLKCFEHLKSRS